MLEFVVAATDPLGEQLEYRCNNPDDRPLDKPAWQDSGTFHIVVAEEHVGRYAEWRPSIRSKRTYHAHGSYDDSLIFVYEVLPPWNIR
jgi:hypothetical protein